MVGCTGLAQHSPNQGHFEVSKRARSVMLSEATGDNEKALSHQSPVIYIPLGNWYSLIQAGGPYLADR